MAWNASRPVPWRRLFIEWGVVSVGIVVVMQFIGGNRSAGAYAGLLWGGIVYLGLGWAMAKLGYQRASLRRPTTTSNPAPGQQSPARIRPAPTKRTSTGPNTPKRRRR
jgi:hypothetical protein